MTGFRLGRSCVSLIRPTLHMSHIGKIPAIWLRRDRWLLTPSNKFRCTISSSRIAACPYKGPDTLPSRNRLGAMRERNGNTRPLYYQLQDPKELTQTERAMTTLSCVSITKMSAKVDRHLIPTEHESFLKMLFMTCTRIRSTTVIENFVQTPPVEA